jgi:hypothetical protein
MPLQASKLYEHVSIICQQIKARPPASLMERSTAFYVENCLKTYGVVSERQGFNTIERFSKRLAPQFALSAALMGGTLAGKGLTRWLTAGLSLALAWHYLRLMQGHPALWEDILSDYSSRNVLACIPSKGPASQQVLIVAHLDSGFERLSHHPQIRPWLPHFLALGGIASLGGGLLPLLDDQRDWSKGLRSALAQGLMLQTLLMAWDEFSGAVDGANDNASGIAVALGLAQQLCQTPLQRTQVRFVFTGAETAGGTGLRAYLEQHRAELDGARVIILKALGVGEPCWVESQALSPLVLNRAQPEAIAWAEQAARAHPELGVMGRHLHGLDEMAVLNHYGLVGLALTAYERESGQPPYLYQSEDTLEQVQPESLARAGAFAWALLEALDQGRPPIS